MMISCKKWKDIWTFLKHYIQLRFKTNHQTSFKSRKSLRRWALLRMKEIILLQIRLSYHLHFRTIWSRCNQVKRQCRFLKSIFRKMIHLVFLQPYLNSRLWSKLHTIGLQFLKSKILMFKAQSNRNL
jgi:hypothetical protein